MPVFPLNPRPCRRNPGKWIIAVLVTVMVLILPASACMAADLVVRYPNVNCQGKNSLGYKMLDLALKKNGEPYRIEQEETCPDIKRTRVMLETGLIDVFDIGTMPDYETRYAAVYFPIDRGLNGRRVLVVRRTDLAWFKSIHSIAGLKPYTAGQGEAWADTKILRRAGLNVVTASSLEMLFNMLQAGRFDFLPLGANEASHLLTEYDKAQNLAIVPDVMLTYPFGRLFFVRKNDTALRDRLYRGLVIAFNDGTFAKLLASDPDYQKFISRDERKIRTVLAIDNNLTTASFKAIPAKFFLNVLDGRPTAP
jgi:hypothetical protein